jgi:nitrogen fixation-related uncharacterized protein
MLIMSAILLNAFACGFQACWALANGLVFDDRPGMAKSIIMAACSGLMSLAIAWSYLR